MTNPISADTLLPELADYPGVLTLPQVASILQVSKTTAYNLAATGELPALRFGGSVRVLKTDLAALIMQRSVSTETVGAAAGGE